jgi:hypothetical protein
MTSMFGGSPFDDLHEGVGAGRCAREPEAREGRLDPVVCREDMLVGGKLDPGDIAHVTVADNKLHITRGTSDD